jgi:hypothetical protein
MSYAIHAEPHRRAGDPLALCRARTDAVTTTTRSDVTCKRCLTTLAKRDRHFQARARAHYTRTIPGRGAVRGSFRTCRAVDLFMASDRAIAAEEGRP